MRMYSWSSILGRRIRRVCRLIFMLYQAVFWQAACARRAREEGRVLSSTRSFGTRYLSSRTSGNFLASMSNEFLGREETPPLFVSAALIFKPAASLLHFPGSAVAPGIL